MVPKWTRRKPKVPPNGRARHSGPSTIAKKTPGGLQTALEAAKTSPKDSKRLPKRGVGWIIQEASPKHLADDDDDDDVDANFCDDEDEDGQDDDSDDGHD